jgi:hypothetical protein
MNIRKLLSLILLSHLEPAMLPGRVMGANGLDSYRGISSIPVDYWRQMCQKVTEEFQGTDRPRDQTANT